MNKICLGTAQFGFDYGIANTRGKIPKDEAFDILRYALDKGIDTLDTAGEYKDSEHIIGEFTEQSKSHFKIISKLSCLGIADNDIAEFVEGKIKKTLLDIHAKNIYAYLIHDINSFCKHEDIWKAFELLKDKDIAQRIGFSLYRTEELKFILKKGISFDIIQVPYSVFDRRFEPYFKLLKDRGIEILVRSIFLQGAVFIEPQNLSNNLLEAKEHIEKLNALSIKNNITISALCLNFALSNRFIDKVIVGVDSLNHLKQNLSDARYGKKVENISELLNGLAIDNENILLPYKWVQNICSN